MNAEKPLSLLSDDLIEKTLLPYGAAVDEQMIGRIREYVSCLLQWNAKISLTTVTNPDEILRVHFGESFFAASAAGIVKGRVADIGTGAGFPGIPVRMVSELIELTLVEPNAKKAAFLAEVIRRLEITRVKIIRCRMEDAPKEMKELDFVVSRALGNYEELLEWSKSRFSQNGQLVLLVGESEVGRLGRRPNWMWRAAIKVPNTRERYVLVGSPAHCST